ncbi:MAG: TrmB family transcriptional regulator [Halobacteriota archaeon]
MDDDAAFITRLIGFGLSEKEAQLYLHLLKYGPKTPSPLAKSLKTYREDVHRTLTSLIEKGMVRPSLDSSTQYTAVELESALESALKKHETELREMEQRKRELEELSRQQRFRPSDEVSTFKILKSVKDVMTVSLSALASAEKEWMAVIPPIASVLSSLFVIEDDKQFIGRGGRIRFITDITYPYVETIREHLDAGMEVRHFDNYSGLLFFVFDGKIGMSVINVADLKRASLSELVSVLWTDDPAYAQYLGSTFELLWEQSIPAEERIQELLKQGRPQIDV